MIMMPIMNVPCVMGKLEIRALLSYHLLPSAAPTRDDELQKGDSMASERSRVTMKGSGAPTPRSAERVRGTRTPAQGKKEGPETPAARTSSKAVAQPQPTPTAPAHPAPVKPGPVIPSVKSSGAAAPAKRAGDAAAPSGSAKASAPKPASAPARAPAAAAPPVVHNAPAVSIVSKKTETPAIPAPAVKAPGVDPSAVAAAVLAQTAPVIEAGIKRVEARVDVEANRPAAVASVVIAQAAPVMEAAWKRVEARVETAVQRVDKEVDRRVTVLEQKIDAIAKTQAQQGALAARDTAEPQSMDEELDQVARTMKRAFLESFERSSDRVALPLVKVQRYIEEIARRAATEAPALREHLSICATSLGAVLTDLGVETFEAEAAEAFDPIIHQCVGEAHREDAAANAVVRSVAPGFRSARGQVLAPALVTVNRK